MMMAIISTAWFCAVLLLALVSLSTAHDAKNVDAPAIYFLFIETSGYFRHAGIWYGYFENANSRYHVSIQATNPAAYQYPENLKHSRVGLKHERENTTVDTACSKKSSIVQHMLVTTLAHSRSPEDKMIILSSDSIPTKSLLDLHASLFPRNRMHNPESRLCLFPPENWEKHAESTDRRLVKHQEWAILSKPHAQTIVDAYSVHHSHMGDNYPLLHTLDTTQPRCKHNYFLYYALYGDVELSADGRLNAWAPQQHGCFVYDATSGSEGSTVLSLNELNKQPDFYFARNFVVPANDSATSSNGVHADDGDASTSSVALQQALRQLGVISNSTGSCNSGSTAPSVFSTPEQRHWNFSFDPIDRTKQFRKLKGDNTGLRVLVVSVDDRALGDRFESADYVSLSAVLRHNYCKKHHYGYVSFRTDSAALLRGVKERYPENLKVSDSTIGASKYGYANFHPGLKQFRAAGFAKLPALWYLHQRYGALFDYIWFQDSDSAPNPARDSRSVGDALREWQDNNVTGVVRGVANPLDATFLFLNNFPWKEDMPCTGNFLIKTNAQAEVLLREWWDYDLPQKNFVDFMEQDSLWYALEAPQKMKFEMNFQHTVALLYERQLPSRWHGVSDLWVVHIANYYEAHRTGYFQNMVRMVGKHGASAYQQAIHEIWRDCQHLVSTLAIAEMMETLHKTPYRSQYPAVHPKGKEDDYWHLKRTAMPPLPAPNVAAHFLDGYALAFHGQRAIYLVQNGTKRAFPNMDTFSGMGFNMGMVLHFNGKDPEFKIPNGPDLPPWTGRRRLRARA